MKKLGLVLATVCTLSLGSLMAQPAKADGGTLLVAGALGWGWCHITAGQPRITPLCWWHDHWHAAHAPAPAKKKK